MQNNGDNVFEFTRDIWHEPQASEAPQAQLMEQSVTTFFCLILLVFSFFHQQVRLQLVCALAAVFYAWTAYTVDWYTDHESLFIPYYTFHLKNYSLLLAAMLLIWVRWFSAVIMLSIVISLFIVPLFGVYAVIPYHTSIWIFMHSAFVLSLVLPRAYPSMQLKANPLAPLLVKLFNWRVLPSLGVTSRY